VAGRGSRSASPRNTTAGGIRFSKISSTRISTARQKIRSRRRSKCRSAWE
jgi:hypothetical protein